jgi:hypothetical protein
MDTSLARSLCQLSVQWNCIPTHSIEHGRSSVQAISRKYRLLSAWSIGKRSIRAFAPEIAPPLKPKDYQGTEHVKALLPSAVLGLDYYHCAAHVYDVVR